MNKWINRYLTEFYTDKTDINETSHYMSALSVTTISVPNNNEIDLNKTAGDLTSSYSDKNFKINENSISCTDNTDNAWIKKTKEYIALNKAHSDRKKSLGHRVQILRVLIKRFLNDSECREMVNYQGTLINDKAIEDYLDTELSNFDYDLEAAVTMYRHYTPDPVLTCKCAYQAPFCSCESIQIPGVVACNNCEKFIPDNIGDGAGIGNCTHGVQWTEEIHGRMPLFRYASRHCNKFSKWQS